jgi:hypothetical protein
MICWSCFSWEALSTLLVGVAVVLAALVLGRRQIEIQRRQTVIQDLLLKTALYERRQWVQAAATTFLNAALEHGPVSSDVHTNFDVATFQSKYLFGEEVVTALKAMKRLYSDKTRIAAQIDERKKEGFGVPPQLYKDLQETVNDLDATWDNLTELFIAADLVVAFGPESG